MKAYVFRSKRRVAGRLVVSESYYGALMMPWETRERRWSLHTSDKREAERKLHEERIRCEKERNGVLPPRPQQEAAERPLTELLDAYLADLRVLGRTPGTLKKYGNMRVQFGRCGWSRIGDVTPRSFSDWRAGSNLAPRTLNAFLKDAGAFFRWLRRHRMAAENPLEFVQLVDTRRREKFRRSLSEAEVRRLIAVAPHPRAVFYLLAIYTGLRRQEINQLTVEDFFLDSPAPFVRLRASTTKNAEERQQRLRPELVSALRAFIRVGADPSDKPFSNRVPRVSTMKKDLEAAGIPFAGASGGRADFHALRDTFGTHLAAAGVPPFVLKELMRHSSVQQSEKYYIDAKHLPLAAGLSSLPAFTVTAPQSESVEGKERSA